MLRFAPVLVSASILMSSTAAQSPCECAITNQASVITASQTCHLVGQGPVACFTFVLGSIPGATTPRPGNCEKEATPESPTACSPKRQCEFAPVRLVVTAASCFKDCGGYDGMIPTYTPADFSVMTPPPTLSAGQTQPYDVKASVPLECGKPHVDVTVDFKNKTGQILFEMRVRYHCAQCPALVSYG